MQTDFDLSTLALPLVVAQFSLIGALVSHPPGGGVSILQIPGILLILLAIGIAIWALAAMRVKTFSVMPVPVENGELCQNGPYSKIRHPMYCALLLGSIGWCLLQAHVTTPWWCTAALTAVLLAKLNVEETFLLKRYPAYSTYMIKTARLIPGVY